MSWARPLVLGRLVRLAWLLPLAAVGLFTLISLAPIDPVQAYVGDRTALVGSDQRAAIAAAWGLDRPATERFGAWLGGVAQGDLGRSITYDAPVSEVIARRVPASLALIGTAFVTSFVVGTGLGIAAATARGGVGDRILRSLAVVLSASPGFWIAILLIAVFAIALGWLPSCCAAPPGLTLAEVGIGDRLRHLVLPVATLSVVGTAPLILHTRQRLVVFLDGPAAQHLRAHGLTERRIAFGAGLRHAVGPALNLHLAGAGELFGGSVLAETVFAWPGLGQATARAATGADAPLLMGIGLSTLLLVFCGNLAADIAARIADPRLRHPRP
ncbi:ABC transporter permease [Mesobaculum littorinae]|uniref:ABC transporter permease n=1 Tax=Mesobaculum littorinae TaxID=2486419 RepID=A0A438AER8_9RHOB|nr:ABC transporter permease [Mesobaculum littorinae]RVV97201.1 ABC transporter permease [Mesobaculum littorinae]